MIGQVVTVVDLRDICGTPEWDIAAPFNFIADRLLVNTDDGTVAVPGEEIIVISVPDAVLQPIRPARSTEQQQTVVELEGTAS